MRAYCQPSPCTTYRPDSTGALIAVAIETREPIIFPSEYEPERATYYFSVVCRQETGEGYHIGNARSRAHAEKLISAHMLSHPEHCDARILAI